MSKMTDLLKQGFEKAKESGLTDTVANSIKKKSKELYLKGIEKAKDAKIPEKLKVAAQKKRKEILENGKRLNFSDKMREAIKSLPAHLSSLLTKQEILLPISVIENQITKVIAKTEDITLQNIDSTNEGIVIKITVKKLFSNVQVKVLIAIEQVILSSDIQQIIFTVNDTNFSGANILDKIIAAIAALIFKQFVKKDANIITSDSINISVSNNIYTCDLSNLPGVELGKINIPILDKTLFDTIDINSVEHTVEGIKIRLGINNVSKWSLEDNG